GVDPVAGTAGDLAVGTATTSGADRPDPDRPGEAIDGDDIEDSLVLVLLDDIDYAYTDQDLIDEAGRHSEPLLKPDWSPDRFRCQMYTNHLGALRRSLVEEVGGFRAGFEGSQDFDLVFRVTERARRIVHVPRILYHWRITAASVNASPDAKP